MCIDIPQLVRISAKLDQIYYHRNNPLWFKGISIYHQKLKHELLKGLKEPLCTGQDHNAITIQTHH